MALLGATKHRRARRCREPRHTHRMGHAAIREHNQSPPLKRGLLAGDRARGGPALVAQAPTSRAIKGVLMIAVKALERRTEELNKQLHALRADNADRSC